MKTLNVKKLGMAFGITGVLLYIGCVLIMLIAGTNGTVFFFNSIFHGLDTTSVIRMDISWWETLTGLIVTFVLAWLTGASVAYFYNMDAKSKE